MIIGQRTAKNVQIILIGLKTWPPGDETSFLSYVNIGITLKIFLSKSTWSIKNTRGDQKVRGKVPLSRIAFMDCNNNS